MPAPAPDLIACPTCDLLHAAVPVPPGGRLRCRRCGAVLMTNRAGAIDRTLAAAFASAILMVAALFFPFLELSVIGLHRNASVLDAALAFSSGLMVPLALATALLIVVIPLVRAAALTYTLLPLRLGRPPAPRRRARVPPRRPAQALGDGRGLHHRRGGGAGEGRRAWRTSPSAPPSGRWRCLVLLVVFEGTSLCEWTLWQTLDHARRR